jgi:hypothetical protein
MRAFLRLHITDVGMKSKPTPKSEGIVLETNIPAKLKTGNVKGKTCWVSWDKIGALLFENYTELEGVNLRNAIRNNSTLQDELGM